MAEPPKPVVLKGSVSVPAGVTVLVDGVETAPVDDKIELSGALDSIQMITLKVGSREETRMVKLTEKGPIPSALTVAEPPKAVPVGVGVKPGGAGKGKTPPPKPTGGADRGFD